MPAAAPMNIDGKTGPPRKLLSDSAYARLLQSTSRRSAPTDHSPACPTSGPSAVCPEKRTSDELLPVACPKPIASPAMSSPRTGISRTMRRST